MEMPFTVYTDPEERAALLEIGDHQVLLKEGEWSEWLTLDFTLLQELPFEDLPGWNGLDVHGLDVRVFGLEVLDQFLHDQWPGLAGIGV